MAGLVSIVVLLILVVSAGLLHVPVVRDFALEESRQYLVENQNIALEAERLDYNVFRLSSTLHNVRVRSTEEPDEPPFFTADEVYMNLEIASLWRGKLSVEEGSIKGGRIEIVYDAEGRSNLPKPVEREDAGAPARVEETLPFLLRNFRASGPLIRFADQAAELELTLPQWTLAIDGDRATENHRIEFGIESRGDLDYQDRSLPLEQLWADLDFHPGGLGVRSLGVQPGASRIELTGEAVGLEQPQLDLHASIQADGEELAAFAGLEKSVAADLDLEVDIAGVADQAEIAAHVRGSDVRYGRLRDGEVEAELSYGLGSGRATVESWSLTGPFGAASGAAALAPQGESTATIQLRGLDLLPLARELEAPVLAAARASGSAELRWAAQDFSDLAGSADIRLAATRESPAENVAPVTGRLRLQMTDGRPEVALERLAALGATVDGAASVGEAEQLDGELRIDIPDLQPAITQLEAFLGLAADSLAPTPLAGPLQARLELGGALDRPAYSIEVAGRQLSAGEVEDAALELAADYRNDTLELRKLSAAWRGQRATARGKADLAGESPALDFEARVEEVVLDEVLALLGRTDPVSGVAALDARVTGTASAPQIESQLEVRELRAYGELWGELSAAISTNGSELRVSELTLSKPQPEADGTLAGSASYDTTTRQYRVDLAADSLRLTSLQTPSGQSVTGTFEIRAEGEGSLDDPRFETSLSVTDLQVGEEQLGELRAEASAGDGRARLGLQAPRFGLDARAESGLDAPYPASFRAELAELDLATLDIEVREGEPVTGAVAGAIEGSGELENWQSATIEASFEQAEIRAAGMTVRNEGPWRFGMSERRVRLESFRIASGPSTFAVEGEMPLEDAGTEGELRLDGQINLDILPALLGKSVDEAFVLGILEIGGAVRGSFEKIEPDVALKLEEGAVFTPETLYPVVSIDMDAHVDSRRIELRNLSGEYGKGVFEASGGVPFGVLVAGDELPIEVVEDDGGARLEAKITGLDLDELKVIPDGGGKVSVELEAAADSLELEAVTARLVVPEIGLEIRELELQQAEPIALALTKGALSIESFHMAGPRTDLRVTGGADLTGDPAIDVQIEGEADMGVVGYLVEDVSMSGPAALRAAVSGPLADPRLEGTFTLSEGAFSYPSPRLDSQALEIAVRFDSERVEIEKLTGKLNGGDLAVNGGLVYKDGPRDVDVKIKAQGVFLDFPEGMRTLSNTDLRFHSIEDDLVRLDGGITIEDGSFRERLDLQSQVLTFFSGGSAMSFDQEPDPFLSRVRYGVDIDSANPILVDNNLAKLEAGLDLQLVGTYYRPSLLGRVRLEEGGEVTLAENRYIIDNGLIEFTNETRIRPLLNLQARTRVAAYDIILRALGSGDDIDTNLTSDPPLPEPDVISLLLTGRTLEQARDSGLNIAREQAMSYLAGSLGGRLGSAAEDSLGLTQVRIEPNLISAEGDPSARLTLGQRITRQLNLIYSMNLTDSADQIFVTEYDVTRRFQTKGVKQSDNSYRFDFRHDIRWGLRDAPSRRRRSGPVTRIDEIDFEGELHMPPEDAMKILGVKPGGKYDFFRSRKRIDRLSKRYRNSGREQARVRLSRAREENTVDLHYSVDAGPQIEFAYQPAEAPDAVNKRVRQAWRRGVFDLQRRDDAEDVLLEWLYADGYLQAEVESEIAIVDEDRRRVQFLVRPGARFYDFQPSFSGNEALTDEELLMVLDRTELLGRLRSAPRQIADALQSYYYQRGYLTAEVDRPEYDLAPDTGVGRAIIEIDEGALFQVGELSFPGAERVSAEEVRAVVTPDAGRAYTPEYLEEAVRNVEDLYWSKGYNDVLVNFLLTRRVEQARVDIEFQIDENQQDVVGDIAIAGNQHVGEKLIRRRLASEQGGLLISDNNDLSRRRLYDTGAFSLVDLETAPLGGAASSTGVNPLRLTARLREVSPYRLRYGAYFDTERGPGLIGDMETRNVLGSARVVGVRGRYDQDFREARGYFSQPLLMGVPLRTTAATFRSRELRSTFTTDRTGVSVQQEVGVGRRWIFQYGYRFEKTHTFDTDPDAFIPLDIAFNLAPLTSTVSYDSRDSVLDAKRGQFFSHGFEFAPAVLGSDVRYIKYFGQYFRYTSFFTPEATPFDREPPRPKLVWASGVRTGLSNGLGGQDIVPSERFFAGGGTTVRGFKQDELGPKDFLGDPGGGEAVFIVNQELRFPMVGMFEGVGFVDLGNVYSRWDDLDLTSLRSTGGFGLRVRTPFFLLRADYGFKLDRKPGESRGAFFFSIGQAF